MEFPKIVYDDFYKFLMSAGLIIFLIGLFGISYMLIGDKVNWISLIIFTVLVISGIKTMYFAGTKWYKNQTHIDAKIKADSVIATYNARSILLTSKDQIDAESHNEKETNKEVREKGGTALVSYKITSILPNSVLLNFSKDYKAWFWIANHELKKYRAYVKIKYIAGGGLEKEITSGHYGGNQAWNLNALSAIQAPGMVPPDEIKIALKEGKRIKVVINCKVHNENDEFVEEKLPQTYIYDSENNNWFLEP